MATNTDKLYSILSYNIGNYEILKELEYKSPNAEYIYVTDNPELSSSTWDKVIYVENKHPEDNFDLCYQIRFNPFDYVSTDIVLRIDGSMKVIGNTDEIIDAFNAGNYDICLCIHPKRNTLIEEYRCWADCRGYSVEQANKVLQFMGYYEGYDVQQFKGLYQYNFMIQRKNKVNMDLNSLTLSLLKYLAPEDRQIERLDQTIGSFVINKYFQDRLKVMVVDNRIGYSKYFNWYQHNSNIKFDRADADIEIEPYLFDKPVDTNVIKYV